MVLRTGPSPGGPRKEALRRPALLYIKGYHARESSIAYYVVSRALGGWVTGLAVPGGRNPTPGGAYLLRHSWRVPREELSGIVAFQDIVVKLASKIAIPLDMRLLQPTMYLN